MSPQLSFADRRTHFEIRASDSPITVDGYARGEPKYLVCDPNEGGCGACVKLDPDPTTPGIDDLEHKSDCPQRFVRSRWFREQMAGD